MFPSKESLSEVELYKGLPPLPHNSSLITLWNPDQHIIISEVETEFTFQMISLNKGIESTCQEKTLMNFEKTHLNRPLLKLNHWI